jgi:hypothetical protein
MAEKYKSFTGGTPKTIYKSIIDSLPPSAISSWNIRPQIRCLVSDPSAAINASWEFTQNADHIAAERVYGVFSSSEWWQMADQNCPEIFQPRHHLFPVSIFIDGAHLDQIGHMC